ncbi:MAG: hypothetical protein IPJ85_14660 [Flavobacteriales bacterium]|nr:hypothetical protein [Flavobacteriales bacterium]
MTSTSGNYSVALPYGSYAVEQLNPNAVQLCPPAAPIAFSVSSGNNAVVNIADSMLTPFDLATYVHSGISRVWDIHSHSPWAFTTTQVPAARK